MIRPLYLDQVRLLLQLLPVVFREKDFFLKGGTAINFFVRDVPRLSVDIDLAYGPIIDRASSLMAINAGMERIARDVRSRMPGCRIQEKRVSGSIVSLYVNSNAVTVKLEMNTILRGSVFPGQEREVSRAVSDRLNIDLYVTAHTFSTADLYAGKICAALDRQHPRDLFDLKILYEHEGLTPQIRKAFVVYCASSDRPMHELLSPKRVDMRHVFESEFSGMTDVPVTYEELESVRERLISDIVKSLSDAERKFLISMKQGTPKFGLLGIPGLENLPGLQWKISNVRKMDKARLENQLNKLKSVLEN
jgi:predicted nucleotidyltransferase component of viral defense system